MNDCDRLYYTYSFCPHCFREIIAEIVSSNGQVYMRKECPEHGLQTTLIWQGSAPAYLQWMEYGGIDTGNLPRCIDALEKQKNYHCAIEPVNDSQPVTAALMVTEKCNLECPVCFTKSIDKKEPEPSLQDLKQLLDRYRAYAGIGAPVEFCGGEPTVREDLFQLAEYARSIGFDYIQLNTNGIQLAGGLEYCRKLKHSGITTIYLGFDGLGSEIYHYKYSADMLEIKKLAISNCMTAGLAIVLVPCIIPGINDGELGSVIRFAKERMPEVRGVYFQPISYFGHYTGKKRERITIPEILRRIEDQTDGEVKTTDFLPGNSEHPLCSFQGIFRKDSANILKALTHYEKRSLRDDNFMRIRQNTKYLWGSNNGFFTIGGMTFQDVWNYDSQRTARCTIQIIGRDGRLVPLCAKYLTGSDGQRIVGDND